MQGPSYSRHYVRQVTQVLLQLLVVTAVALLTRLVLLEAHSLWLDEAISLETTARNSPADLWPFLRRWDMHPPFYYQVLDIWTTFLGTSLTALRVPSVLAGTLTVPVYYIAVMQLSRRRTAFVAALLLALTPMQVEIGQEARMYALLTLWVCGALVCMVNLLRREAMDSARGFWLGLAVCLAGASYTHNTGGPFLAVALTLPVLAWRWMARRGHKFPQYPALNARGFTFNWVTALGLAFLMWLPWAPAFWAQTVRIVWEFWVQPLTVETVAWTYLRLTGFNWLDTPVLQLAGFGFLLGSGRSRRLALAPVAGDRASVAESLPGTAPDGRGRGDRKSHLAHSLPELDPSAAAHDRGCGDMRTQDRFRRPIRSGQRMATPIAQAEGSPANCSDPAPVRGAGGRPGRLLSGR